MNCWEFKNCEENKRGDCPAYPKGGAVCYMLKGTVREKAVQGAYALKINECSECDFYKRLVGDKTLSREDHLMGHPHSFKG